MQIRMRLMPMFSLCLWGMFFQMACKDTHYLKVKNEKVILKVNNGDVLEFTGFEAKFHLPSPCDGGAQKVNKCVVKIDEDYGEFSYGCAGGKKCDPEMEVGDVIRDVTKDAVRSTQAVTADTADRTVDAWCAAGTIQVQDYYSETPNTTIGPDRIILFQSNGTPKQKLLTWRVTPASTNFCKDDAYVIDQAHPSCQVKATAGGDYKYKVYSTSPACNPSAEATVMIR